MCWNTELEIGEGMFVSTEYVRVTFGDVSDEERTCVRAALLKYCHLDTLAMIRIIQALKKLVHFTDEMSTRRPRRVLCVRVSDVGVASTKQFCSASQP